MEIVRASHGEDETGAASPSASSAQWDGSPSRTVLVDITDDVTHDNAVASTPQSCNKTPTLGHGDTASPYTACVDDLDVNFDVQRLKAQVETLTRQNVCR